MPLAAGTAIAPESTPASDDWTVPPRSVCSGCSGGEAADRRPNAWRDLMGVTANASVPARSVVSNSTVGIA
eukprot:scaffold21642_cov63-Phaeocystis_antarctica.AAC.7